jgi:hypothetical protein
VVKAGQDEVDVDDPSPMRNVEESPFSLVSPSPSPSMPLLLSTSNEPNNGGVSVFGGVGERTREGNDLYEEMKESGVINEKNFAAFPMMSPD